jgi:hypothetical protein
MDQQERPRGGPGGLRGAAVPQVGPEDPDGARRPTSSMPAAVGVPEVLCRCGPFWFSGPELLSSEGRTFIRPRSGLGKTRGNALPWAAGPEAECALWSPCVSGLWDAALEQQGSVPFT